MSLSHNNIFHFDVLGQKPFKCDQCDYACKQSFDLTKHKHTPGGEKPHKCEMCPKQFTHSTRLREHQRLHTGERPFNRGSIDFEIEQKKQMKKWGHLSSFHAYYLSYGP